MPKNLLAAFGVIMVVAAHTVVHGAEGEPIRIVPLGDSITQGDTQHDSFRRPLYHALVQLGYNVDFVGSEQYNHGGPNPNPDFDLDHEGHYGWRADELASSLGSWLSNYTPDVALMHVGTNDAFQNQSTSSTLSDIEDLIQQLRSDSPGVHIILAKLIATDFGDTNALILELNASLDGFAAAFSTESSPIVVVDLATGFDATSMTSDGVHPNPVGEEHMADGFVAALV
ncbi:MAG: SGNH/GDSL hydrolase family protein, partial [Polyangiales bacterium]